jgi:hypothetical protein
MSDEPGPVLACSLSQGQGRYAGFDEQEFTCRSGGKPAALRHIKASGISSAWLLLASITTGGVTTPSFCACLLVLGKCTCHLLFTSYIYTCLTSEVYNTQASCCQYMCECLCLLLLQEKWGYEKIIMVGDGATDMEARLEGAASLFIGWVME